MVVDNKLKYRYHIEKDDNCCELALKSLEENGFAVVEGVFDELICDKAVQQLRLVQEKIVAQFSEKSLVERKENTIIRLPMKYNSIFYEFFDLDFIEAIVHGFLNDAAIVRNYSGQFVYSNPMELEELSPYNWYHKNFRHVSNCPGMFLDMLVSLKHLGIDNGVIVVVPGSHKWSEKISDEELEKQSRLVTVGKGGILFTDGMLWHREKVNVTSEDMAMLIVQFVMPFVKQHIDYPRALGSEEFEKMSARVKKFMGWYSRVPASLEEYYKPLEERSYVNSLPGDEKNC